MADCEVTVYGCPTYDINRLCRYDRRAIDKNCGGCQRKTDKAYLELNGLWVVGISHRLPVFHHDELTGRLV